MPRSDPAKHKRQIAAANKARYDATKRLIDLHQDEFDALYAEEAARQGVDPKGSRPRKATAAVPAPAEPTLAAYAEKDAEFTAAVAAAVAEKIDPVDRLRGAVEGFRAAVDGIASRSAADAARAAASEAVADALGVEHDPFATVDALLAAEGLSIEPVEAVSPKPPF